MSLFVNTPDSDNQLVRSALRAWTVFRLTCSLHRVHCSLHRVHCSLHRVHCSLHRVHCSLHRVHCFLHRVHCSLHRVHCSLHRVHCSLHRVHCSLHSVHCSLHRVHCSLHRVHCSLHRVHCSLHSVHCSLHSVHCSLHSVHCSLHRVHCSLHRVHCSLHSVHCSLSIADECYIIYLCKYTQFKFTSCTLQCTLNGIRSLRTGIMEEYPVMSTSQGTYVRIEQTSEEIRVTYEICRAGGGGGTRTGIENRCSRCMTNEKNMCSKISSKYQTWHPPTGWIRSEAIQKNTVQSVNFDCPKICRLALITWLANYSYKTYKKYTTVYPVQRLSKGNPQDFPPNQSHSQSRRYHMKSSLCPALSARSCRLISVCSSNDRHKVSLTCTRWQHMPI